MTLGSHLVGKTAQMTITVADDMTAAFDDEHVHAVYGTAALVRHVEQVSRRLLRPHLNAGVEGVGAEITVRQLAPVAVGATVTLNAEVVEASSRRMLTTVEALVDDDVVATATFTQVVVDVEPWRASARR